MPATPAWPPRSAPRLFVATPLAKGEAVTVEGMERDIIVMKRGSCGWNEEFMLEVLTGATV